MLPVPFQRQRQLKNRMKKKRKARQMKRKTSVNVLDDIQKQVRAIASFIGTQPTDLDLVVGDTVKVVARVSFLHLCVYSS